MDLMWTDLDKLFKKNKSEISDQQLIKLVYNSLCALAFMHEANVVHRDLKPANLLIDENCNVRISDFGLSRTIP